MTTHFVARQNPDVAEVVTEDRHTFGELLLCALVPWALFGHQLVLMMAVQLDLPTRHLTVLGRGFTVAIALATLAWVVPHPGRILQRIAPILLISFWAFYLLRVGLEAEALSHAIEDADRFPLSYILQMGLGACFLPACAVLGNASWRRHRTIRNLTVALASVSGVLMLYTYGSAIANFDSRWKAGSQVEGAFAVHPLALGYLGAALIAFSIYFFCCLNDGRRALRWSAAAFLCGLGVPLLVGSASRGPVLAVSATILILLCSLFRRKAIGHAVAFLVITIALTIATLTYTSATGSNLVNRLLAIDSAIEAQSGEADRLVLYAEAFSMFLDSPVFGESTKLPGRDEYPHNLFVESLMATGLVGTIPLVILLGLAIRAAWRIMTRRPELAWMPLLFLLNFVGAMFSFAIYTNVPLWLSLAATFSCAEWIRETPELDTSPTN